MLAPLPRDGFDTAYVESPAGARGHPPDRVARRALLGATAVSRPKVEVRHEVESASSRSAGPERWWPTPDPATTGPEVWDAGHWSAAQAAALGRTRGRHLSVVLSRRT